MNRRKFLDHSTRNLVTATCLATVAGCGGGTPNKKGFGASGVKQLDVLGAANIDIERFHNLKPEQEKAALRMEKPAADVIIANDKATDAAKSVIEKVRKQWQDVVFVNKKEGKRIYHRLVLQTNAGDLHFAFFENVAPDHVRNFLARAKAELFKGQELSLNGDVIDIGPPVGKEAYGIKARALQVPVMGGVLFAYHSGPLASGERYGVSLQPIPSLNGKVTMFGRITNANPRPVYEAIVGKLKSKPGSVVIEGYSTESDTLQLFRSDGSVLLPDLDPTGEPSTRDMEQFARATTGPVGAADPKGGTGKTPGNPNAPKK